MRACEAGRRALSLRARPLSEASARILFWAGAAAWLWAASRARRQTAALVSGEPRAGWCGLLKMTVSKAASDQVTRMGASLAFYTLVSMAPLALIAVSVLGLLFGPEAARGIVFEQLRGFLGPQKARALQAVLASARSAAAGTATGAIGFATLLYGASYVVSELQTSLDFIFGLPASKIGWKGTISGQLTSLAFVLATGFLLMLSLFLSTGIALAGKYLPRSGMSETAMHAVTIVVTFCFLSFMFAFIYRVLPRAIMRWKDALVGGLVTAALFEIGNLILGIYLGKSGGASAYGAAGSILALLLWAYYCAQIVYVGAEFADVYANERGYGVVAKA